MRINITEHTTLYIRSDMARFFAHVHFFILKNINTLCGQNTELLILRYVVKLGTIALQRI
jgi:hypothetical protein